MSNGLPTLCNRNECRRKAGHGGLHNAHPSEAWEFFEEKDKNKLAKAGFATPRGGEKGAYQNHVTRNNKVIIPYERLTDVKIPLYQDGFVIRVLPEQYFDAPGKPKEEFLSSSSTVRIGENSFILYRTHEVFERLPPLAGWQVRALLRGGVPTTSRSNDVVDTGHYVLRMPRLGDRPKRFEGPPQGVFAPEYADEETNYLSKCVLAWLIIQTQNSPYTLTQATHLRAILRDSELDAIDMFEGLGVLRRGLTSCPLCMRFIKYRELHATVSFEDENGLTNASEQIEGATRSTIVNLFHVMPLLYHQLTHIPENIGWGHAICNTRLGQRPCYSMQNLMDWNLKVGIIRDEGLIETFGWISPDWLMIRSPNGAVWMQLNGDVAEEVPQEPEAFDITENQPPTDTLSRDDN